MVELRLKRLLKRLKRRQNGQQTRRKKYNNLALILVLMASAAWHLFVYSPQPQIAWSFPK